ncbi:MAG: hypothetical protein JWR10_612, partial [Rubritepida sp.]|nr:hypothetical protein [Rubritepida sp.]
MIWFALPCLSGEYGVAVGVDPICKPRRRLLYGAMALLSSVGAALAQPVPDALPERPSPDRIKLLFCGDSLAQGMFLSLNGVLRRRDTIRVT